MTRDSQVVFRIVWLVACVILADATLVLAQGGLGTLAGRLVDQNDAVLPGVTVTATNTRTNVSTAGASPSRNSCATTKKRARAPNAIPTASSETTRRDTRPRETPEISCATSTVCSSPAPQGD